MGQAGKEFVRVTVESDWWSRINWTQVVGWLCSGVVVLTGGKLEVPPEMQAMIVLIIQGVTGLMTIYFRRTTTTITPSAAEKLRHVEATGG